MPASQYPIPAKCHEAELEIKKSRFITFVSPVSNQQEAVNFIAQISELHSSANHNCWAYIAGTPENTDLWECSDDGEPKGTAGKPMLNVLQHSGIGQICVVVTRYFGGIKLGAGGLVRAYSQAVKEGLAELPLEQVVIKKQASLTIPFDLTGDIEHLLRQLKIEISDRTWQQELILTLQLNSEQAEELPLRLERYGSTVRLTSAEAS